MGLLTDSADNKDWKFEEESGGYGTALAVKGVFGSAAKLDSVITKEFDEIGGDWYSSMFFRVDTGVVAGEENIIHGTLENFLKFGSTGITYRSSEVDGSGFFLTQPDAEIQFSYNSIVANTWNYIVIKRVSGVLSVGVYCPYENYGSMNTRRQLGNMGRYNPFQTLVTIGHGFNRIEEGDLIDPSTVNGGGVVKIGAILEDSLDQYGANFVVDEFVLNSGAYPETEQWGDSAVVIGSAQPTLEGAYPPELSNVTPDYDYETETYIYSLKFVDYSLVASGDYHFTIKEYNYDTSKIEEIGILSGSDGIRINDFKAGVKWITVVDSNTGLKSQEIPFEVVSGYRDFELNGVNLSPVYTGYAHRSYTNIDFIKTSKLGMSPTETNSIPQGDAGSYNMTHYSDKSPMFLVAKELSDAIGVKNTMIPNANLLSEILGNESEGVPEDWHPPKLGLPYGTYLSSDASLGYSDPESEELSWTISAIEYSEGGTAWVDVDGDFEGLVMPLVFFENDGYYLVGGE